ncbi:Predicted protein [Taphrina deformans PYCC 5710]|uniref:SET domain-containing protein n=1 Tax=Taphrina deformans (strain PYCC 5710 / ATCC 11124 / CBS 356.35 / IMI 108563 / JCM 9778 / NBRC 8474) TaxID=1097556 RepID=R4XGG9_TAPDE|nr:Predicted protein [Taphrina deformans PYCC 5710]|eukprot:CCG83579.1 Predicted protein [Taphrina deformans PYCC 5710]
MEESNHTATVQESLGFQFDDDEVLIERARYTRALSTQLKKLHDEAKKQGQVVALDITENLLELQLEPVKSRQRLPRSVIHKIYPPSRFTFDELERIPIKALTPHTPLEGKSFLVYTTTEAVRVGQRPHLPAHLKTRSSCTYISVTVADKSQSDRRTSAVLELYNCFIRQPLDEILPKGSTLRIKEPFYTLTSAANSERLVIRVDHPTDVEVIHPFAKEQPASHWKRLGDAAFGLKRFHEADAWLTKGIQVHSQLNGKHLNTDSTSGKHTWEPIALLSNRAAARLEQGRFDGCISDCQAILKLDPYNFKAIYRRAKAYLSLSRNITFTAVELTDLIDHIEKHPEDCTEAVQSLLDDLNKAILQYGQYNFAAMYKTIADTDFIHATSFEHNDLVVVDLESRGQGVVSTNHIKAGTLLVVSPAEALIYHNDPQALESIRIDTVKSRCDVGESNELVALLTGVLDQNPSKRELLYKLYAGSEYKRGLAANDHTIDAFRMYGVQLYNSFDLDGCEIQLSCLPSTKSNRQQRSGTGVWYYPSYFNHSCLNNCSRTFIGNLLIIKASRDIGAGEELTLGYVNKLHDFYDRKDCFYDFGFDCDCHLCKINADELRDFPEECENREVAIEHYKSYAAKAMSKGFLTTGEMHESADSVAKMIADLRESYSRTGRNTMRYGLLRPLNALCTLHLRFKDWTAALSDAKAMLDLSPPDHGIDDLVLGARTLVVALQFKISFMDAPSASQTLEINHSLSTLVEAWNIKGLVSGFGGYWDEFGEWWHDFLACSKVREDSTRQRILRAFLDASKF